MHNLQILIVGYDVIDEFFIWSKSWSTNLVKIDAVKQQALICTTNFIFLSLYFSKAGDREPSLSYFSFSKKLKMYVRVGSASSWGSGWFALSYFPCSHLNLFLIKMKPWVWNLDVILFPGLQMFNLSNHFKTNKNGKKKVRLREKFSLSPERWNLLMWRKKAPLFENGLAFLYWMTQRVSFIIRQYLMLNLIRKVTGW